MDLLDDKLDVGCKWFKIYIQHNPYCPDWLAGRSSLQCANIHCQEQLDDIIHDVLWFKFTGPQQSERVIPLYPIFTDISKTLDIKQRFPKTPKQHPVIPQTLRRTSHRRWLITSPTVPLMPSIPNVKIDNIHSFLRQNKININIINNIT